MDRDTARVDIKTPPPGPNARKWAEFHRRYAARSTYHEGFIWDRSKPAAGPFCMDVDGNVILDFVSHVGSSALGYNHPDLVGVATRLQITDPDRYAGCDFIGAWGEDPEKSEIPTPSHLHYQLMEITSQFGFGSAFFSNSGAEAVENAAHMGSYFLDQLRWLQKKYDFISDGRGIGLMDAMEIDTRERRDRILRRAMERGLLLLGSGYKVVRFLPPVDVRRREIDMALEILHGTFRNTKR